MVGGLDRRSVLSIGTCDVGCLDSAGPSDGDAPSGPIVRTSADSQQGLPVHGRSSGVT